MNNLEIVNNEEEQDQSNDSNNLNKSSDSTKIIIDVEGIPILEEMNINYQSAEQYYRLNYPDYKIIKLCKFTFIKMGKLITFNFDKSNNYIPRCSIGPHWYLTIILYLIIFGLSSLLYKTIFYQLSYMKILIFNLFIISVYILVLCTSLIHPKIIMNKKKNSQEYGFCNKCKVYYNPYDKIEHCDMCGVCLPKMDHHCVWMGKCIANKNVLYFYATLVDIGIFYAYIIYCVIIFAVNQG